MRNQALWVSSPAITNFSFKKLILSFLLLCLFFFGFSRFHKAHAPAPNVIGEWRMDEGSGTTIADASGNGQTGTLTNGAAWTTGKYGTGVSLDGTNDYINIADNNNFTLDPTQSYTWSCWLRNTNFSQWSTLWSQTAGQNSILYFYTHSSNDGEAGPVTNGISIYWYTNGSQIVLHSNNNVLTAGQWSNVAITYDGTQTAANRFSIYVNGVDVTQRGDVVSSGTLATLNPTAIRIGSNQPYGEYMNGAVDEFRFYRRLLSVAEIQSDMTIGNGPDTQNPTASISSPANGASVSGTINVNANATDNIGVVGVQFLLDGVSLGVEDLVAPYSVSWNSTTASNGSHTLTARSRDAAGNTFTSTGVSLTVSNDSQAPTVNITTPATGSTVTGTINVDANSSDNVGVVGVQFLLDGVSLGAEDLVAPYSVSWNTATASIASHTLTARARDAAGNITTSAGIIVTVPDTQLPTASVTSPTNLSTVSGTINVNANASDNVGVVGVQFLLDGNNLGSEDLTAPYSISWNTIGTANGIHTLTARSRDAASNAFISTAISVTVNNDVIVPIVSISSPTDASTVTGNININATASDNIGVIGVQFKLDGINFGSEDLAAPYSIAWNTNLTTNGSHTLTATARDGAGNTTTTPVITVTVSNDADAPVVTISSPTAGSVVAGLVDINGDASDNIGVVGVQFLLDGVNIGSEDLSAPYAVQWNSTTATNGAHNLTARARDAAGNLTTSPAITVNVNNLDAVLPTASISSPANGASVIGTININATATDNIAVIGVQFLLDGNNLGAEDLVAPYSFSWNTIGVTNGSHSLTARSRDAAGNTFTSLAVVVTVNNDIDAPSASISSPADGSSVNGTISITSNASDNVGVVGVQFLLDGNNLGAEDLSAPYSTSWSTVGVSNGAHNLAVRARDAAGNVFTSTAISVTVNNDVSLPTASITSPTNAATVAATINVNASASDNIGVVGVQFLLDGVSLGAEDLIAPYSVSWNTTTSTNGTHSLTARARDAAGNTFTSTAISVTVSNAPSNLILALAANEGSGTTAADISGNSHNGTLTNGPTWLAGKYGQGINLDGANDFINIADHNNFSLDPTQSYTWSCWVKNTNLNQWSTLWSQTQDQNNILYFYAHSTTDAEAGPVTNGLSIYWYTGGSQVVLHSNNNVLTAGQWSNVAITYNGALAQASRFTIWVNGVDVTQRADVISTGTIAAINPTNIRIGSNQPYGEYMNAAVDEVRYYKRALSGAEVVNDMNTPIAPDAIAPAVSITDPANAATVSGTINVSANATDNIGIAGVQFLLDGNNLGAEDITAPYSVAWNTATATNGSHTLTARARDAAGNNTISTTVIVTVSNDTESPLVNISAPTSGSTVTGTINVNANASDNTGVVGVQFILDGNNLGAEDLTAPFTVSWNTATATVGSHNLTARARDAAGNTTTSAVIPVTVPDTELPVASISSPANGASVNGTINVNATASDNVGVTGVQFLLDGVALGAEDLSAPYTTSWNTTSFTNGSHTLSVVARDAAGNLFTSSTITVTVNNDTESPSVSISSPINGASVSSTITVSANASDNVGVVGVQFILDGNNLGAEDLVAPYSVSWNTATATNGSHNLTARARDAAGNTLTSAITTVSVDNFVDTELPFAGITAPTPGSLVSGTINVNANASDNVGVVGVQFLLNGNNLGTEDLTAPYSVSWNTTGTPNGVQGLTARVRDAAGNVFTSTAISVTVNNDVSLPTASITSPTNAATVAATINVNASASDNIGVTGVQFLLDGVSLGAEDLVAPYSVSWNTTTSTNGTHSLTARARDAAGNTFTSTAISVTVSNAPSNLILALAANEGSGTTAADISGNSHNGTLTNGPTWLAGKYGQGINLDGANDFINIADHNNFSLDPTQSYTWSCWVKNTNLNQWSTLWSQTQDQNNILYFYAHSTTDAEAGPVTNGLSIYWYTAGSQVVLHSTNNVLTAGQWSNVAITYNGALAQASRFTIWVNGVDVTQRADVISTGTIAAINPTNIRIGSNQPYGEYMNAAVDEVRYYKRALSGAEVVNDMNTPIAPDAIAPAVSITDPANAATVSGTINVSANATDNIGIAGVQFLLDGNNLGAEDITAPYSVAWNTATATSGAHVLSARARDAAGNTTTSTGISVTVLPPAPDYTFTLQATTKSVSFTGTTDFKADIVFLNGFNSNNIALSVTGLPANVTGTYAVNPMTDQGTAQLNIASTNATPGSYNITLTALAEGITHTQQATLIITGADDFILTAVPPVQNVLTGNGVTYTIQLTETGNWTSPVVLSLPGLPAGMTASFNPASVTPAGNSTLTLTTTAAVPNGTYNFNVTGTSNSIIHTTPITLTVSNIPPNTLQLPSGFSVMNVAGSGWSQPMGTAFTSDGQKMFVWERSGVVYVCNRNSQQLYDKQTLAVLDIQTEVGIWGDHGLMSVALDPAFTSTGGYIYLLYVVDRKFLVNDGRPIDVLGATIGRVTRYKVITNGSGQMVIDPSPAERKILLGETKETGVPVLHDSHGMGTLLFAADGTLIVSTGDGASYISDDGGSDPNSYYQEALTDGIIKANENVGAFRSQLLNCLNGKILRLDPATGDGVSSNPYYDPAAPRSAKSRVWALGLRNPFRMTFKPGTGSTNPAAGDIGELYLGDVGYNSWEELNVISLPGMNCGWPLFEGLEGSSYMSLTTTNRDEPANPLFGGSCGQYYQFRNLLKQATEDGITTLFNPCNNSIPIANTTSDNRFYHRRPILDWRHTVTGDITRLPTWNGNLATASLIGTPASGATGPIFIGNASVGGCWYTGTLFPEMYRNTYFHGDYGGQWLKNFKVENTDQLKEVRNFATGFGAIISIVQNPADGTVYCVDLGDNSIKRISYGGNQYPVVVMTSDKKFGPSTLGVQFNGSSSYDPEGANLTYAWNFGDNTSSTQATPPVHNFTAAPNTPTKYVVRLTVTDNFGASSVDSIIISVNNTPPVVNITSPIKNSGYRIGPDSTYTLSATVTDAEHSAGQLKYQWQTVLRHNNHAHPGPIDTVRNTSSMIVRVGCNGDEYYYKFLLTVTDAAGLSTTDSSNIYPDCPGTPLLVLREFSVTPQDNQNLVKWSTEQSWQLKDFEVEVSSDNINYQPVNSQPARNTSSLAEYDYSDSRLPSGVKYYRLKMIEVGNNIRYSGVVKTYSGEGKDQLQISPNPVVNSFYIRYDALDKGAVKINITDMSGKQISGIVRNVNKGQNIIYLQADPSWKQGTYMVSVQQGGAVQYGKMMRY